MPKQQARINYTGVANVLRLVNGSTVGVQVANTNNSPVLPVITHPPDPVEKQDNI